MEQKGNFHCSICHLTDCPFLASPFSSKEYNPVLKDEVQRDYAVCLRLQRAYRIKLCGLNRGMINPRACAYSLWGIVLVKGRTGCTDISKQHWGRKSPGFSVPGSIHPSLTHMLRTLLLTSSINSWFHSKGSGAVLNPESVYVVVQSSPVNYSLLHTVYSIFTGYRNGACKECFRRPFFLFDIFLHASPPVFRQQHRTILAYAYLLLSLWHSPVQFLSSVTERGL